MDVDLKIVEIGYLKNPIKTGIIQQNMAVYNLEKEIVDEKVCFIVDDKAIDINNFNNIYPIIKRNSSNQILETQEIDSNIKYAITLKDVINCEIGLLKKINYNRKIKQYKKNNS